MTTEDYSIGDDDSENAMDWTPTGYAKSFFRPQNHARAQVQERTPTNRRNPFYGTLPPAPTPPAHRIRNLGRHIPSPAPNPAMQKGMFSQPSGRVGNSFAMNLGRTAGGDRLQPNDRGHNLRDLAESKLVLGRKNDSTGLEPIFNTSFSLDDEPSELKEKQQYPSANTVDKVPTSWRSLATRGIVFPFAFGAVAAGVKHAAHS